MILKFWNFLNNRQLWLFAGSGLLVSVAYIDPGNWGTNISAGAEYNYDLLWVIWMASAVAMLFQYLSGKLGIVGHSLPDLVRNKLQKKWKILTYWLLAEISILATELAEFLGIVVALQLLFGIPMIWGTFISLAEVVILFILFGDKLRRFEKAFVFFVGLVGLAFLYEVIITSPDLEKIVTHSVVPTFSKETIILIVGIIGATVMPHALFVHSWFIKGKMKQFPQLSKKQAAGYHLFDNVLFLFIAGLINASMLIMAAAAFFGLDTPVATLEGAYETLKPLFGEFSSVIFGLALLSAGIASSITGAFAGQALMDSLTNFKISVLMRRLITRVVNIIPLTMAILMGFDPLNLLVYSQVVLSLLIPLPMIPIIYFSSQRKIMGEIANHPFTTKLAWLCGLVIIGLNIYLLYAFFVLGIEL